MCDSFQLHCVVIQDYLVNISVLQLKAKWLFQLYNKYALLFLIHWLMHLNYKVSQTMLYWLLYIAFLINCLDQNCLRTNNKKIVLIY